MFGSRKPHTTHTTVHTDHRKYKPRKPPTTHTIVHADQPPPLLNPPLFAWSSTCVSHVPHFGLRGNLIPDVVNFSGCPRLLKTFTTQVPLWERKGSEKTMLLLAYLGVFFRMSSGLTPKHFCSTSPSRFGGTRTSEIFADAKDLESMVTVTQRMQGIVCRASCAGCWGFVWLVWFQEPPPTITPQTKFVLCGACMFVPTPSSNQKTSCSQRRRALDILFLIARHT